MDNLKVAMGNTEGFLSETLFTTRAQWKMQLPLAKMNMLGALLQTFYYHVKLPRQTEWFIHGDSIV